MLRDPKIHPDFELEINVRHAEGAEISANGASTQLIASAKLKAFPLSLQQWLAVHRETDLVQKEWMQDCVECDGEAKGFEQLFASYLRLVLCPSLLPVKLEAHKLRNFSVCSKSPIAGLNGGGVLMIESDFPAGVAALAAEVKTIEDQSKSQEFVPRQLEPKATLMNGGSTAFFITPSGLGPNFVDGTVVAKTDVPVPRWLVPLSLWKRVIALSFSKTLTKIHERVVQRWEDLDFDKRIAALPELYQETAKIAENASRRSNPQEPN